jgi:uncharacterized protein (DUF885 family)
MNVKPTKCNICGGNVIYTKNSIIYGKEYGSGYCYYCENCNAYVGTHKPRPKEAFGILANPEMRKLKMKAHSIFDALVGTKKQKYKRLAKLMNIKEEDCHFGYMDTQQLIKAINIMKRELDNE